MRQDRLLIISGSRDWVDPHPIRELLLWFDPAWTMVIHGAARGADRIAHDLARQLGFVSVGFPADWKKYDLAAGPIRNEVMQKIGIANKSYGVSVYAGLFPLPHSKGTRGMHKLCLAAGFAIHVPVHCKNYL